MYNFVSSRILRERGRRIINDAHDRIHKLPEHAMIAVPCNLIDRHFQEGNNLTINSGSVPSHLCHSSTDHPGLMIEELYPSDQPPPTYQDVTDGRLEMILWILKYLS